MSTRPFVFDLSFDEDPYAFEKEQARKKAEEAKQQKEAQAKKPPPPPTFTEQQLQEAKAAAFAEGEAAGKKAALTAIEAQIAQSTELITGQVKGMIDRHTAFQSTLGRATIQISAAIARKLLPTVIDRYGLEEVERVILSLIEDLSEEPRVTITLAPDTAGPITERLEPVLAANGMADHVTITPDPALGPSDCRVLWGDGGAERRLGEIWGQIDQVIERHAGEVVLEAPAEPAKDPAAGP